MATKLTVTSMTCEGCEDIIQTALEDVDGVESAETDRNEDVATVEGDVDVDDLIDAVDMAGYEATVSE